MSLSIFRLLVAHSISTSLWFYLSRRANYAGETGIVSLCLYVCQSAQNLKIYSTESDAAWCKHVR